MVVVLQVVVVVVVEAAELDEQRPSCRIWLRSCLISES